MLITLLCALLLSSGTMVVVLTTSRVLFALVVFASSQLKRSRSPADQPAPPMDDTAANVPPTVVPATQPAAAIDDTAPTVVVPESNEEVAHVHRHQWFIDSGAREEADNRTLYEVLAVRSPAYACYMVVNSCRK